jgi:hypothetical protein
VRAASVNFKVSDVLFHAEMLRSSNSSREDQTRNTSPKQHCFVILAPQSFILKRSRFADLDQEEFSKIRGYASNLNPIASGRCLCTRGASCIEACFESIRFGLCFEHCAEVTDSSLDPSQSEKEEH